MEQAVDNVHGWLMNVPNYHQEHHSITRKSRSLSVASISSEDSINLEELINVNFTTSMDEETDLNDLSLLDLDDSKEDFWKVDSLYTPSFKPSYSHSNQQKNSCLYQKDNENLQNYMNTLDMSYPATQYNSPSINLFASSSTQRPISLYQDTRVSSSLYHQNRFIRPSESSSTSSFDSQSTETSTLSRNPESTVRRKLTGQPDTRTLRRASHIPAPVNKPIRQSILPTMTKSTTHQSLPRTSHIPPPRSTTSLGISSLCSSKPNSLPRSKTAYLSSNPSRSSSLRLPRIS